MNLQRGSLSLGYQVWSRPLGKVRRRVQEMRYASFLSGEVDLSHNESTRLATDALLDRGLDAYCEVLAYEDEVDFLSQEEKDYILKRVRSPSSSQDDLEEEQGQDGGDTVSQTSATFCHVESENKFLDPEHGWPAPRLHLQGTPTVELFLQSDRTANVRDRLREGISKATSVLAIVMDMFSDVEIFCDILEAMKKRSVPVYLLLDDENLHLFVEMCENMQISSSHLAHMSVRSVCGDTYCAKSGKKFTGQVKEKFVIIDSTQVLAGSFSFTWLSWQVHRSLAMVFKGSSTKAFELEFRRLYASSSPVPGFPASAVPRPPAQRMDHIRPQHMRWMTPPLTTQPGCWMPLKAQQTPKRHIVRHLGQQSPIVKEHIPVYLGWRSHQMARGLQKGHNFWVGSSFYYRKGPNTPAP